MTHEDCIEYEHFIDMYSLIRLCHQAPPEQLAREAEHALRTGETDSSVQRTSPSRSQLPAAVRQQLRQSNSVANDRAQLLDEPRFSVQARQMNAADFFAQLTQDSPYNLIVHPDVRGSITVSFA